MSKSNDTIIGVLLAVSAYFIVASLATVSIGYLWGKAAGKAAWAVFGAIALGTSIACVLWAWLRPRR